MASPSFVNENAGNVLAETCHAHPDTHAERCCRTCSQLCCANCIENNHRSCADIECLTKLTNRTKSSDDYTKTKESMIEALHKLQEAKKSKQEQFESYENEKKNLLSEIQHFEDQILQVSIPRLAKNSKTQVISIYEEHKNEIFTEIDSINKTMACVENDLQTLELQQDGNKSQLSVHMKDSQNYVLHNEEQLRRFCATKERQSFAFYNAKLKNTLEQFHSLGEIFKLVKCSLLKQCNILIRNDNVIPNISSKTTTNEEGDKNTCNVDDDVSTVSSSSSYDIDIELCDVSSVCFIDDETLLVVDRANMKVKKLDKSYNVTDYIDTWDFPSWAMCCTGVNEVAISIPEDRKIQFIATTPTLLTTISFHTSKKCYGIACHETYLYIGCGDTIFTGNESDASVSVYNRDGDILQLFQMDEKNRPIFSSPVCITFHAALQRVYIADRDKGLICLDKYGKKQLVLGNDELQNASSVCILDNEHLIVSSLKLSEIYIVHRDGKVVQILSDRDAVDKPHSLAYNKQTANLVVGMKKSNEIMVFCLQ